jgi:predicted transcriptional regulator
LKGVELSDLERQVLAELWAIVGRETRTWAATKEMAKRSELKEGQIRQGMVGLKEKGLVETWSDSLVSPWTLTDEGKEVVNND